MHKNNDEKKQINFAFDKALSNRDFWIVFHPVNNHSYNYPLPKRAQYQN